MTRARYYAGIGSRATPTEVLSVMREAAQALAGRGYILRSGGAVGADSAFEGGADLDGGRKEIFYAESSIPTWAFDSVERYHPAPNRLTARARRLMARNAMQVLGMGGGEPVAFVLCWTPGGTGKGGTGQALRIATDYGIPIFDLARPEVMARVNRFLARARRSA
ncbi:conserved hypothetical protein (plasmid) [Thioalkalivibrio sp. K90mix]|uniref:hypothetical protein n=1 Tax=Thioalkalivibrio sp. (strain K90mix) TaxID=396595 RepID=UPI000195A4CD|nr:hypothetical protein [Thioalkalivibrio sp. K90mix]ADC73196.1 conserved hypothetical protein [Thioalkalivibrio sp. K90mix]